MSYQQYSEAHFIFCCMTNAIVPLISQHGRMKLAILTGLKTIDLQETPYVSKNTASRLCT
jgi:hypothetical protein